MLCSYTTTASSATHTTRHLAAEPVPLVAICLYLTLPQLPVLRTPHYPCYQCYHYQCYSHYHTSYQCYLHYNTSYQYYSHYHRLSAAVLPTLQLLSVLLILATTVSRATETTYQSATHITTALPVLLRLPLLPVRAGLLSALCAAHTPLHYMLCTKP